MPTAAEIYASELLPKGYGFPLWVPDPQPNFPEEEVRLFDVGYVWEGSFCTLFNPSLPLDHPVNQRGVPEGFVPLTLDATEFLRITDPFLPEGVLCSESVKQYSVRSRLSLRYVFLPKFQYLPWLSNLCRVPSLPLGTNASLVFKCKRSKGALLILSGGGAKQEVVIQNRILYDYVARYHASWHKLAEQRGHFVEHSDIVMISGNVKSSDCTVAAFTDSSKKQALTLDVQGGIFGSAGVSLTRSSSSSASVAHRSSGARPSRPSDNSMADSAHPRQCSLFVLRLRVKPRSGPKRVPKVIRGGGSQDDDVFRSDDETIGGIEDGHTSQSDTASIMVTHQRAEVSENMSWTVIIGNKQ